MSERRDDFVTIRPRKGALAAAGKQSASAVDTSVGIDRRGWFWGAALLLLFGIGAWVVVYLPDQIQPVAPSPSSELAKDTSQDPAGARPQAARAEVAPYRNLRNERERREAHALLTQFVELQIRLEDEMTVANWAPEALANAQRLANDGDALFVKEQFDAAMATYREGIKAMQSLVAEGEAGFDGALANALEALARGQTAPALQALATAKKFRPTDARLASAEERARKLPDVLSARRTGDEAMTVGNWSAAIVAYEKALGLDPGQADLPPIIADARGRASQADFGALLSRGYAALDGGQLDEARAAFSQALQRRPDDQAAADGLAQAAQGATVARIERFHAAASIAEQAEDWRAADANYTKALAVDGTLKFAVDGRALAQARMDLDQRLEAALSDPGRLSTDLVYADTAKLYREGVDTVHPGPRLTAQLDRLEAVLATAAKTVPVVFVSDDATAVTILKVGPLGRFTRKELPLRPGRYVVTGEQRGCRDVRLEIDVSPSMPPVEIRCFETL